MNLKNNNRTAPVDLYLAISKTDDKLVYFPNWTPDPTPVNISVAQKTIKEFQISAQHGGNRMPKGSYMVYSFLCEPFTKNLIGKISTANIYIK